LPKWLETKKIYKKYMNEKKKVAKKEALEQINNKKTKTKQKQNFR